MKDRDDLVIGIDIGTSNLSVAVYWNGFFRVLEVDYRQRTIPSYLFFNKNQNYVVGPWRTYKYNENYNAYGIYEIKRLIGRKSDEQILQKIKRQLSYRVESLSNRPVIVLQHPNGQFRRSPYQILSCLLEKIKSDIINKFQIKPRIKAVLTVPAHFNISQRDDVFKAAQEVDIDVIKLLNEPSAVALRYFFLNKKFYNGDYFLVYSLGGGFFDAVIYQMIEDNVQAIAVIGDSTLGGHDFDIVIFNHVCDILKKKYQFDIKADSVLFQELRSACEITKIALSTSDEFTISLSSFFIPNVQLHEIKIKRKQFEKMISKILKKTIKMIEVSLEDNNLSKKIIKNVILSGGSTRIPIVRELLSKYFGEDAINKFIYRDETVAEGAALQAAVLSNCPEQSISILKISDVSAFSLGVRACPNMMNTIIKRNTPIPYTRASSYVITNEERTRFFFDFYEGERIDCRHNRYLMTAEVENISQASQVRIDLTMIIDKNGRLSISAIETLGRAIKELSIVYREAHIINVLVKNSLYDAIKNKKEDQKFLRFAIDKRYLLYYCHTVIFRIQAKGLDNQKRQILNFCQAAFANACVMELKDKPKLKKLIKKTEIVGHSIMEARRSQ